jgi:hypothetical protein
MAAEARVGLLRHWKTNKIFADPEIKKQREECENNLLVVSYGY